MHRVKNRPNWVRQNVRSSCLVIAQLREVTIRP